MKKPMTLSLNKSRVLIFTAALLLVDYAGNLQAQSIRYVKPTSIGTGNGSSWANASGDLQLMINNSAAGDSIFVSAGIYLPSRPANNTATIDIANRNNAFVLKAGVKIYGGFAGTEASLAERELNAATPAILSGEIGLTTSLADNCYHVVIASGKTDGAVLDGFTITAGNANGNSTITINTYQVDQSKGGGMFTRFADPVVNNCLFYNNKASDVGGAMCNLSVFTAPAITNCTFRNNTAGNSGGGIFNDGASPRITRCAFVWNYARSAGALYNTSSTVVISCRFAGNQAASHGGAVYNSKSPSVYFNCIFSGNIVFSPVGGGGGIFNNSSSPLIYNCTFSGNVDKYDGKHGGGIHNFNGSSPIIRSSIIWNNSSGMLNEGSSAPTVSHSIVQGGYPGTGNLNADPLFVNGPYTSGAFTDGDYRLKNGSPAINTGTNEWLLPNMHTDQAGNPRVSFITVDMGALESPYADNLNCNVVKGNMLYVDSSVLFSGNGQTWSTAFKNLQEAMTTASLCFRVDSILVAKGTYYPTARAGDGYTDRDIAFTLVPKVRMIGGFPSGGGTWDQRILPSPGQAWKGSILSGDLDSNDVLTDGISTTIRGNNAYHVVVAVDRLIKGVALEGFTVTGGNADAGTFARPNYITVNRIEVFRNRGGGLYTMTVAPEILHCMFAGNYAFEGGGGICTMGEVRSIAYPGPTVINCYFSGNTANRGGGGAIRNENSQLVTINAVFSGNNGSDIWNSGGVNAITNCTFSGNNTYAISNERYSLNSSNARIYISNSIVYGNSLGINFFPDHNLSVYYSLVQGLEVKPGYASLGNIDGKTNPLFVNPSGGDYRLRIGSPAINAGHNSAIKSKYTTDILGHPRIQNESVNMGAYESVVE
jgi:hypothetical protein